MNTGNTNADRVMRTIAARVNQLTPVLQEDYWSGTVSIDFSFHFLAKHSHVPLEDIAAAMAHLSEQQYLRFEYIHNTLARVWMQSRVLQASA